MKQIAPVLGFLLGGLFAWIDLVRKYSTTHKYLYRLGSTYVYIILASLGASGVTYGIKVIGVSFSTDAALNVIIMSLLGAGLFIGLISTLALPSTSDVQYGSQLKTLRDFVFDYLSASINRKLTQRLEKEIRKLHYSIIDKNRFYDEADLMLNGITELTDDEKIELSAEFSVYANEGRYASIIRELTKYRDIDFIIQQLSDENILQNVWTDTKDERQAGNFLKEMRTVFIQFLQDEHEVTSQLGLEVSMLLYQCFGRYAQKQTHDAVAQKYYQKAFEMAEQTAGEEKQAIYSGCLGKLALENERWSDASKWFLKEYSLTNNTRYLSLLAEAKSGLAQVFKAEKRQQEARQWAQEALTLYTQLHDTENAARLQQFLDASEEPSDEP